MGGKAILAATFRIAVTLCVSLCVLLSAIEVKAQTQNIESRRQYLLQTMLQSPGDLRAAYEYASLSTQVGDYEAAISTLERMLIFSPNNPSLQLELGILYYRLGSYEVAQSYFAQVLANPSVSPEIAAQVRLYLQQVALEAEPPQFSATIFSGIRWESNANAGPASQTVTLNGLDFTLDNTSVAQPDWSAVNIGTLHYNWNLNQGDRIELDAITYNATYFDLSDIDLNFGEVTLGPSFNMRRWDMDKTRFFVYGIGDESAARQRSVFRCRGRRGAPLELCLAAKCSRPPRRDARPFVQRHEFASDQHGAERAPDPRRRLLLLLPRARFGVDHSSVSGSGKTPRSAISPTMSSALRPVSRGRLQTRLRSAAILGPSRSAPVALTANMMTQIR